MQQLLLFAPAAPGQTPYRLGWLKAHCGMVFWEWNEDTPNLQPFRYWICWRGLQRATPSKISMRPSARHAGAA